MKIALAGAHGSGKSTIISSVYSELKKDNVRISLAPEVARSSLFLAAQEITPKMQMDLFGRQISSEMTNSRNCDILLCDRSIFDIMMYTKIFFQDDEEAKLYVQSMNSFCKSYSQTYDHIFLTTKLYPLTAVEDDIRPKKEETQRRAADELKKTLDDFTISYSSLGDKPEIEILDWINTNRTA